MTDIGDLPEAEWTRLAKQLIRQFGEQELYQQLFAWEREQSHWEQSSSQFELDVLSLHMARLPDNPAWCDFIPFNRKYRPEVLCKAEILWLKCSGCGKRYEMTGTQFKNIRDRSNGKLYCRKCGDWMPVHPCAHPKEGGDGNG